jgi:proline iminopeptidase
MTDDTGARRTFRLPVSAVHELHVEEWGNPAGQPVVCLHGGPGAGLDAGERRLFEPAVYRVIHFDQRGCGRSTPFASLEENTTWDLVADLETLRLALGLSSWLLFGGSWGVTLALAYAQMHPGRVTGMILRGVFLFRPRELAWFYQDGASRIFPDRWEAFVAPIPEDGRGDLVAAYHARLRSPEAHVREAAARAWCTWELSTCSLAPDEHLLALASSDGTAERDVRFALALLETYYLRHGAWLAERPLLARAAIDAIRHIPAVIVHGRYDQVCPLDSAWALHRAWPEATLHVVESSGHYAYEPAIERALRDAADALARR